MPEADLIYGKRYKVTFADIESLAVASNVVSEKEEVSEDGAVDFLEPQIESIDRVAALESMQGAYYRAFHLAEPVLEPVVELEAQPQVTAVPKGPLKLNVGCGFDYKDGYINVDMNDFHNPDFIADITDLRMFPSNTYEEVYAKDVLEHFRWKDTPLALSSWNRILKSGGKLLLVTMYLPGLARRIMSEEFQDLEFQKLTIVNLFSMQSYPGDYHYASFTERLIRFYAWGAGFIVDSVELVDDWLIRCEMTKIEDMSFDDIIKIRSNREFVKQVYLRLLCRDPDPDGMKSKIGELKSGVSRLDVIRSVIVSDERQELLVKSCPDFELSLGI